MKASEEPEVDLLFAYGTLRRGFSRHSALQRLGARYLGPATAPGELFDLGNYPGARPSSAAGLWLVGELFRLRNPARALKVLDELEGCPPQAQGAGLFKREVTTAVLPDGELSRAWIYWLNRVPATLRRIPSNDYARR